jgi:hypothetical protein
MCDVHPFTAFEYAKLIKRPTEGEVLETISGWLARADSGVGATALQG